jgi:PAS domain S-box-containing protein
MVPNKYCNILAIDDNQDNLITVKALIKEAFPNANTYTALNGPDGIEIATSIDPDVILLDIVMPGMDGFEVCRLLKADEKLADIPVIFLTAMGDRMNKIKALDCGAEGFLAKPLDELEITAQIRAMIKIKKQNIEKRNRKELLETMVVEKNRELTQEHQATLQLVEKLKEEIIARQKSEALLRESEWFFKESQSAGKIGSYSTDFINNTWQSSDVLDTIFGITANYKKNVPGWSYIVHPDDREMMETYLMDYVIKGNHSFNKEYRILRPSDGETRWVQGLGKTQKDEKGNTVSMIGTIQDITKQKISENRFKLSYNILNLMNTTDDLTEICNSLIQLIQSETEFDAVGIRLKKGDDYPYFYQIGFSESHLKTENSLIEQTAKGAHRKNLKGNHCLECLCGMVIEGQVNIETPFITKAGSFYTNNSPAAVREMKEESWVYHPRNLCIIEGYLSIAIIPIRIGATIVGTLQLNNRKKDSFTSDSIQFFESLCEIIGLAINRKQAAEKIKESEEKLLQTSIELRQLAFHLISVREDERKIIAREIHDELGQGLTSLKFGISWIKQNIHSDKELIVTKANEMLDEITLTIKSFRRIYSSLQPALLEDLGLSGALDWLISNFKKNNDIHIGFTSNIENEVIEQHVSLILYRLIQEGLTNIIRYANAKNVSVILNKDQKNVFLKIEDDGCGFDISSVDNTLHHGILGMRERVFSAGGQFSISSMHGKGTVIEVHI